MTTPITPPLAPDASPAAPPESLAALRVEIDRIDAALHGLLMERGGIIGRLIAVKGAQGGGSAFRPGREAEMMRRLAMRHNGILPLDTVESIWRIIISTFTYVQMPYSVHADQAALWPRMRDSARFHFGFTVPLVSQDGTAAVIDAVAAASGDLGLVAFEATARVAWWTALQGETAPKIIARLPFVERGRHAADLPLYVVAKPLADAAGDEIALYAIQGGGVSANDEIAVIATVPPGDQRMAAVPGHWTPDAVAAAFAVPRDQVAWIGSHARRFEIGGKV